MAEVRLDAIRPGFDWSITLQFPAGFLAAGESVRMRLRRYAGAPDAEAVTCTSVRADDEVTISLNNVLTAQMKLGSYVAEAVIYEPAVPTFAEIPLTTNRYLVEVDPSPSEIA